MGSLVPGQDRLGPYRLVREIGIGAMGTVYLAETDVQQLALKVLHPHVMRSAGSLERFQREYEAGARVRDPNVVHAVDVGTTTVRGMPYCYLAMEYVEGRTLRQLLEAWGVVPEALLREIARQTASGLAAIHRAGIVHRDLKPENVLITSDHRVRIMDLGVARLADAAASASDSTSFRGSLPYGAPEQFRGEAVEGAADLYSLGVLLLELATGRNPFQFDEMGAIVRAHLDLEPPSASEGDIEITPFLDEVLRTLLAKRPGDRFPSAEALEGVLEAGEGSAWWQEREQDVRARSFDLPNVPVRRETRLYGREEDLALLARCWVEARAGAGRAVLVEGEAGIGKSRLVDTFLHGLHDADVHVLYGSYPPVGGRGAVSDAFVGRFGELGLESALARYAGPMTALAPSLTAALLHHLPPSDAPAPASEALAAVCRSVMHGMAAERPVVWVIEDLHFANAAQRNRVAELAQAAPGHRVLLILTTRPDPQAQPDAPVEGVGEILRVPLHRLGAREVVLLLQDAFRSEALADRLGARIALKSDGIPFFVFEMIRELRDEGFIAQSADGTWIESRVIDDIRVPSAVKDLIEVRVDVLTKEERAILDAGAVQGFTFDPQLVAAVVDTRAVAVLQDLAHIERSSGIVRAVGRSYRFDHHQIHEVLYGDLPDALREAYHAACADAILAQHAANDAEEEIPGATHAALCRHYLLGQRGASARPHLRDALAFLRAVYRQEEAASLAHQALSVPGLLDADARVEILVAAAETLHVLGRTDEERRDLEEAVALAGGTEAGRWRAHALAGLGRSLQRTAEYERATSVLDEAVTVARAAGDVAVEARATHDLGVVCYAQGNFEASRLHHERHCELAEALGDPLERANAIGGLGTALSRLGRYEEAIRCFERHLEGARACGARLAEGTAHGNLGVTLADVGRYDEAEHHYREQLAIARETGNRQGEARATGYLAFLDVMEGRVAEALERYRLEASISREIGDQRAEAMAIGNQGTCHVRLGRFEEAERCFLTWLETARATGNRAAESRAHGQLGHLCMQRGRHAEARDHFQRWLEIAQADGDADGEAFATGYLGSVLATEGRLAEAYALTARHLAMREAMGKPRGEGIAAAQRGGVALDLGHVSEARALHTRYLEIARRLGEGESQAHALQHLADVAEYCGRYEEALRLLDEAEAVARSVEAGSRRAQISVHRGVLLHRMGRHEEASHLVEEGLRRARGRDDHGGMATALRWRGRAHAEAGRAEEARAAYEQALRHAEQVFAPGLEVLVRCELAALTGGDAGEAAERLAEREDRLDEATRMEAHHLLWRATRDATHLREAHRLLEGLLDRAPPEDRATMRDAVRLHRAILGDMRGRTTDAP